MLKKDVSPAGAAHEEDLIEIKDTFKMFINAIQIYRNAVYMLESIDGTVAEQLAALTSAAISVEAFINELPVLADSMFLTESSPAWLRTFVQGSNPHEVLT